MNYGITLATSALVLGAVVASCSSEPTGDQDSGSLETGRGEHDRDGAEHDGEEGEHGREGSHGEEGEESGTELALSETYDAVRNGARLILAYDAAANTFAGTVENVTDEALKRVRVEVHLSNGRELGPTTPVELAPGEKKAVKLAAESKGFERWNAHPEVGSGEHGGREGEGEHGSGGERDREGEREHR